MEKKLYAAPQCEVMELELQGMIAASGVTHINDGHDGTAGLHCLDFMHK